MLNVIDILFNSAIVISLLIMFVLFNRLTYLKAIKKRLEIELEQKKQEYNVLCENRH